MLKISKWNITFVLMVLIIAIYYVIPNLYGKSEVTALPNFVSKKQVNLGLDLQGGSHLLLEVDTRTVLKEKSDDLVDDIRKSLRKSKIKYSNLGSKVTGAVVNITDPESVDLAKKNIEENIEKGILIKVDNNRLNLNFSEDYIIQSREKTLEQSIEVVRKRVDESGTKEPTIQKQGEERIVVQLPGIKDPERVKALIGRTAKIKFSYVRSDYCRIG